MSYCMSTFKVLLMKCFKRCPRFKCTAMNKQSNGRLMSCQPVSWWWQTIKSMIVYNTYTTYLWLPLHLFISGTPLGRFLVCIVCKVLKHTMQSKSRSFAARERSKKNQKTMHMFKNRNYFQDEGAARSHHNITVNAGIWCIWDFSVLQNSCCSIHVGQLLCSVTIATFTRIVFLPALTSLTVYM